MSDETFTEPPETTEEWVDIRMNDPEEGEWNVDFVVVNGQVEYVDLQVRPDLVSSFVECLLDDVTDEQARSILSTVAERQNIDPDETESDDI